MTEEETVALGAEVMATIRKCLAKHAESDGTVSVDDMIDVVSAVTGCAAKCLQADGTSEIDAWRNMTSMCNAVVESLRDAN